MSKTLIHTDGQATVDALDNGRSAVKVHSLTRPLFVPISACLTSYPIGLVEAIFEAKGPAYVCDEILREESEDYVQKALKYDLLSYKPPEAFEGRRLLDFGCGAGSSTMILARMFPETQIVGIELEDRLLSIARLRAGHYKYDNVELLLSPSADELPPLLDKFDFVVLSAVFEHLLPSERVPLLRQIWGLLNPGGTLFLNQTPNRYFPVETHTTGLPLINYMPDRLAFRYARFAARDRVGNGSWSKQLRDGIRGATIREIVAPLNSGLGVPVVLEPTRLGVKDRIDLWYAQSDKRRKPRAKKVFLAGVRSLKALSGITLVPYLSLAIAKQE